MTSWIKTLLWTGLPVLLLTASLLWLSQRFENHLLAQFRAETDFTLGLHATSTQRVLYRVQRKLDKLEAFLAHQTEGGRPIDVESFNIFAAGLLPPSNWIRTFQVVSNGVIIHTYPLRGNEPSLGYDLMQDPRPEIGDDVSRALGQDRTTITGPIDLLQGGLGIIMRKPLSGNTDEHQRMVAVVLNLAPLLGEAGIREDSHDDVQLAIRDESGHVFFGPPSVFAQQPLTHTLLLADGAWEMGAVPRMGWGAGTADLTRLFYWVGIAIITLVFLLVFTLARRRAELEKTVRQQTQALHQELAEHKQTEAALQLTEQRLRLAVDSAHYGIFDFDIIQNQLQWDARMYALYGIREEDFNEIGEAWRSAVHPEDLDRVDQEFLDAQSGKKEFNTEFRVVWPDEQTRFIEAHAAVLRGPEGSARRVIGLNRDITERIQAETALSASEARYHALFEHAPDGITIADSENNYVDVNPTICDLLGYSREEFIGLNAKDIVAPMEVARIDPTVVGLKAANTHHGEWQLRRKDHSLVSVDVIARVLPDGNAMAIVRDITERRKAERALRESEERFAAAFRANPAGVALTTFEEGRFLDVNDAFLKIFGFTREQVIGKTGLDLGIIISAESRRRLIEQIQQTGSVRDWEAPFRRRDGSIGYTLRSIERLTIGGQDRLLGVILDITDRKAAEAKVHKLNSTLEQRVRARTHELERANKDLETFSYSVSHDLRAPLRAVSGFAEIIARRHIEQLNDEGQRYVNNIVEASARMGYLIDDLLNFSRLGRRAVKIRPVSLDAVMAGVLTDLAHRLTETGAKVTVAENLPMVLGDRTLLEQILSNLLGNAVTYHRPGVAPVISVTATIEGDRVHLIISDNGMGIPPEHFDKIFNIFQRLHSEETFPGTGIGLAIVKKSVELLGGTVTLESIVGEGSAFTVKFAAATSPSYSPPSSSLFIPPSTP